ncbi:hypothetical protein [Halomonas sp. H5]
MTTLGIGASGQVGRQCCALAMDTAPPSVDSSPRSGEAKGRAV